MFGGLDGSVEVVRIVREGEVKEEKEKGVLRATCVLSWIRGQREVANYGQRIKECTTGTECPFEQYD
jgi:hypothetical protein